MVAAMQLNLLLIYPQSGLLCVTYYTVPLKLCPPRLSPSGAQSWVHQGNGFVAFVSGWMCFFWGIASCPVFSLCCVWLPRIVLLRA